ncbi:MAG TPA: MFS transporter [Armatimonadota bacterium]|jgi:fucose permease
MQEIPSQPLFVDSLVRAVYNYTSSGLAAWVFHIDILKVDNLTPVTPKFVRVATVAAFASLLSYAVIFSITPASMNEIGKQYGASTANLAWLVRLMMTGFFIAVLSAARYSDKHGKLKPLLLGCLLMAFGLGLFACAKSFNVSLIAIFLAGLGGGACEGTSTALLSDLYSGSKRTAVMNGSQAMFGLGGIAAPFSIGQLIHLGINWRLGYIGAAVIAVVSALVVVAALVLKNHLPAEVDDEVEDWRVVVKDRFVIMFALGMMLYVAAEGGPANWLAVFFRNDIGSSAAIAASSLSFFWFGILIGRIIAASISKCVSDIAMVRGALFLAGCMQAVLLLLHATVPAAVASFLLGLFLGPIWPTIAALAGSSHPRQSGTVLGIVIASGSLGAVIFPPIIGWLSVLTGMRAALWSCVVMLATNLLLFARLPRNPVEGKQSSV